MWHVNACHVIESDHAQCIQQNADCIVCAVTKNKRVYSYIIFKFFFLLVSRGTQNKQLNALKIKRQTKEKEKKNIFTVFFILFLIWRTTH